MRHVPSIQAKPNYSVHFRNEGTFSDIVPPAHSFTGSVKVPLRLVACHISLDAVLPILCPYTMEAIGSCRVAITHPSSGASGVGTPESSTRPLSSRLPVGQRHTFQLAVTSVKGLTSGSLSSIHAQVRLSSLVGHDIAQDETFSSTAIDLDKSSVAHLALKRSVSVIVTPDMLDHMQSSYASVDFFARLRPEYLHRLERWDVSREQSVPSSGVGTPSEGGPRPSMRRCETDFLGAERHDVLATISILELTSSGSYDPVDVVNDTFNLHQGVQRRIGIKLRHSSGQRLMWTNVEHAATGDIRLFDKSHVAPVESKEVQLAVSSHEPEHLADGTSILSASGPWDSGAHGCIHLDRRTPSDHTVLVRLVFLVNVDTLQEPASFALDLPIKILDRDSRRRSSLMSYFAADKTRDSLTAVFAVELSPPLAQSTSDLWRLDTSKKHVRGEEGLGDWRPRGVSLIEDWQRAGKIARGIADKQSTIAVLDLIGDVGDVRRPDGGAGREDLMRRCVGLWQKQMDERYHVRQRVDDTPDIAEVTGRPAQTVARGRSHSEEAAKASSRP